MSKYPQTAISKWRGLRVSWDLCVYPSCLCINTDKDPIAPVLYLQSVMLSVLSVLTDWSMLRFLGTDDVGMSWLAVRALRSGSPLLTAECLQAAPQTRAEMDQFTPLQLSPATVRSQLKRNLKGGATTNEIKGELAQTAAAKLLPNDSYATANVSLYAR